MTSPTPSSASPPPPSPAGTPAPPHPDKALLEAWLLLLLAESESYGWALVRQLRDRGIIVDPSLVYRDLRALEAGGTITSRWVESASGPRRRSYRLTRQGRRTLDDLAADVTAVWDLHETFVRTHAQAAEQPVARADDARPQTASGPPAAAPDVPHIDRKRRAAPPAAEPAGPRPGRELQAAWVLLLLERGASYGYELRFELAALELRIDPPTLYRLLRRLEHDGWLQSRWINPIAGPRRRLYRVTPMGRRNLDELAALITRIRDTHGAFLRAYAAARKRPGGGPLRRRR